jgi:glycosyltransferase involved in cell wall biosynthesis
LSRPLPTEDRRAPTRGGGGPRVVMVIQGFHPLIGGAERQLQLLAPQLRRRGVDVHVVTRRYDGLPAFEVIDGIPVHRVAIPGPKPVASLAFTFGTVAMVRRLRPDVVHAHELLSPTTAGVIAATLFSIPLLVKVLISGEVERLRTERPLGRLRWWVIRRRARCVLAITDAIDGELAHHGLSEERRRLIPNGVDVARYAPASPAQRMAAKARFGLPSTGPVVTFVGRLEEQKNLRQLVEVWSRVRGRVPDATLVVAGTGSLGPALRELADGSVRFLGPVADVVGLLQASEVFVLPSWREGLSNSLLEAMSAGLAVVTTAVGGTTEVVDDERSALLIPPGDAGALEEALVRATSDPSLRASLGREARHVVQTRFSLDDRVAQLCALYEEVRT